MKQTILLALIISATGSLCAQENYARTNTDKTFEPPANSITRRFVVDLGKGNKMQLEVSNIDDVRHIRNIDSLVKIFLHDMEPLKDSLTNELAAKRIDYAIDSMGRKKIRLQQYAPKGNSFLVDQNDVAALKIEQDTIYIMGVLPGSSTSVLTKKIPVTDYYRIGFFINQLAELPSYMDGRLKEKADYIANNANKHWVPQQDGTWHLLNGDASVSAKHPAGTLAGTGDFIELKAGINLQNYKNYFVPSFIFSANVYARTLTHRYQIGAAWEPHFLFSKNAQGNLQTYRNDFITLLLGRERIHNDPRAFNGPYFSFFQHLSVGYLIRSKGDFYDPHTFRVGTGLVEWQGGKVKFEPLFYFHDFFKGVTPGVRVTVNF